MYVWKKKNQYVLYIFFAIHIGILDTFISAHILESTDVMFIEHNVWHGL